MIIGRRKNIPAEDFSLELDEKDKILRCNEYKYLGVIIDDKLTWKSHIKLICEKIGKTCGAIAKLRHCVNSSTLKSVYYALVYCHTQYCNIVWGDATKKSMKPLKNL